MYPILKIMRMLNFLDTFSMGVTLTSQSNTYYIYTLFVKKTCALRFLVFIFFNNHGQHECTWMSNLLWIWKHLHEGRRFRLTRNEWHAIPSTMSTMSNMVCICPSLAFWWVKPQVYGSTEVVKIEYRSDRELWV